MNSKLKPDLEAVRKHAINLNQREPREPSAELAGFPRAARCLDKCRATLLGLQGDYDYACPMDQIFLKAAGIRAEDFKTFVATGASDEEVARWIEGRHPTARPREAQPVGAGS